MTCERATKILLVALCVFRLLHDVVCYFKTSCGHVNNVITKKAASPGAAFSCI